MKKLYRVTTVPVSLDKLLGAQLRFMNQHFEVTAVSADPEELQRIAKKYGVRFFPVEMTREITPLKDIAAVWKLYRHLRRVKPEIVHSHTPKAGIVAMLAAWLARVPVRLHTVAGLPLLEVAGQKRKLLNLVEKVTYLFATRVYPNSVALKEIICTHNFCPTDKLQVIAKGSSNGIDTAFFNPKALSAERLVALREQLRLQPEDFVFVFVGRLVKDKGINELIAAFKTFSVWTKPTDGLNTFSAEKFIFHQHLKLLLVGTPEEQLDPLLPETLKEIEQNPSILTVGWQEDVGPFLAISDALVFPSYREGFPNVVLQAGAFGLPSIVTDINGCNEIIRHGENGLIIPSKNAEALRIAMREMVRNKNIWKEKSREIRNRIVDNYAQEFVWNSLLEEYHEQLPDL